MFDIGWTELLIVATVAILVVGPKDLPRMLRSFGKTVGNLKRMANEFQGQFSEALREAETQAGLDDAKESMADLHKINPLKDFKDSINPLNDIGKDINTSLNSDVKPAAGGTDAGKAANDSAASAEPGVAANDVSEGPGTATTAASEIASASEKPDAQKAGLG